MAFRHHKSIPLSAARTSLPRYLTHLVLYILHLRLILIMYHIILVYFTLA